jgi:hypothetical protein
VRIIFKRLLRWWWVVVATIATVIGIADGEQPQALANLHFGRYLVNIWFVVAPGAVVVGLVAMLLEANKEIATLKGQLSPAVSVECGNILGEHLMRWFGPGATEHPPILLLLIQNESPAVPVNGCRVQVWFDPWDTGRFDPLPRDLPWWRGYERYGQGERPLETTLAPGGSGLVVLVDDSDLALRLRPFDVDEENREYVDATVVAWGDRAGRTERRFRLTWQEGDAEPIAVTPTDGGPPCVGYERPPSIFFGESA